MESKRLRKLGKSRRRWGDGAELTVSLPQVGS